MTAAEANPCKEGNDASFRVWSFAVGQQLTPLFTRYGAAIDAAATDAMLTADAVTTAGTLTADETASLTLLTLVRPASTGKVGATEWTNLYKTAINLATKRIVAPADVTLEAQRKISAAEAAWLGVIEAGRPTMNESGAYATWYAVNKSRIDSVRTVARLPSQGLGANDAAFIAQVAKSVPVTAFDEDALAYQKNVVAYLHSMQQDSRTTLTTPAQSELATALVALKPAGGGEKAYVSWIEELTFDFKTAAPTTTTALFTAILAARPCGAGETATLAYKTFKNTPAVLNNPLFIGTATLADSVAPTACE